MELFGSDERLLDVAVNAFEELLIGVVALDGVFLLVVLACLEVVAPFEGTVHC